jgi:hypothetical protein
MSRTYCFGLVLILSLFFQAQICRAQCSILNEKPLMGIGVSAVFLKGDTAVVASKWKAHTQDRILSFAKPERGARSATIAVLRKDGHVQGIKADRNEAYFFTADSLADYRQNNQSYKQHSLRRIWYLYPGDSIADDESYLYILSLHLSQLWPIKVRQEGSPNVIRRVYSQGSSLVECHRQAELYVAEECGPQKKTRKITDRYCDDGITFYGAMEFECAASSK